MQLAFEMADELEERQGRLALRDYQVAARDAIQDSLRGGKNPVVALPTGAGKSLLIADLCENLTGRILVVTHQMELVRQNELEMVGYTGEIPSVYSAGLGRKETSNRVIMAGIQSVGKDPNSRLGAERFDYIIVDESHRVPPPNKPSLYRNLLRAYPHAKRIGMSATPYRLDDGRIWASADQGGGQTITWFDDLAYHIGIKDLIPEYLCPLVGVDCEGPDLSGVKTTAGDFSQSGAEAAYMQPDVIHTAVSDTCNVARDRESWIVFCVTVMHAERILGELRRLGISAQLVTGKTPTAERCKILEGFKAQHFRALVNVGVATTGFNAKCVDAIVLYCATQSKGKFIQMIGRGCRQHAGKEDCMILDYGGNLERHMPLDHIPTKVRRAEIRDRMASLRRDLAEVRHSADEDERELHGEQAARGIDPLGNRKTSGQLLKVLRIEYIVVRAASQPGKHNVIVKYQTITESRSLREVRIWLCPEYDNRNFAWKKTHAWWDRRAEGVPLPPTSAALRLTALRYPAPKYIEVKQSQGFDDVCAEHF